MSFTFYRKYRPTRFKEVIGQEAIVQTLENSLITGRISHAYLFTGPRGTGKTTLARLFAQALNCSNRKDAEPCGKCVHCTLQEEGRSLDVIEIDAASHTGVDHIRELKETVSLTPALGKYKVYIIDEAHMLSLGAWNALLKTLEEPPAHVIFILATTNAAKVPETILSRALRFDLSRFPIEKIVEKLRYIARSEKIKIDDMALLLLARSAQGGMRDAEALFTQIATLEESPIEGDRVALLLGATNFSSLGKFMSFVPESDLSGALGYLQELKGNGANLPHFALSLLEYLRKLLVMSLDPKVGEKLLLDLTPEEKKDLTLLAEKFENDTIILALEYFQAAEAQMKTTPIPELPLEIALAKLITTPTENKNDSSQDQGKKGEGTDSLKKTVSPPSQDGLKKSVDGVINSEIAETRGELVEPLSSINLALIRERWQHIVGYAKALNASVGVALSSAIPSEIRDNRLILKVKYPFHKERLEEKANRLTLEKAFDTILEFRVLWKAEVEPKKEVVIEKRHPIVDQALEMLGGKLAQTENS